MLAVVLLAALALGSAENARVELGRLLFFDRVLSEDGSLSCAHCHRPESAFTDGRTRARGRGGVAPRRRASPR